MNRLAAMRLCAAIWQPTTSRPLTTCTGMRATPASCAREVLPSAAHATNASAALTRDRQAWIETNELTSAFARCSKNACVATRRVSCVHAGDYGWRARSRARSIGCERLVGPGRALAQSIRRPALDAADFAEGPVVALHLDRDLRSFRHAHGDRLESEASTIAREARDHELLAGVLLLDHEIGRLAQRQEVRVLLAEPAVVPDVPRREGHARTFALERELGVDRAAPGDGLTRVRGDGEDLGAPGAHGRLRIAEHELAVEQLVVAGGDAQAVLGFGQAERIVLVGADDDRRLELGLALEAAAHVERAGRAFEGGVAEVRAVGRDVDRVELTFDRDDVRQQARRAVVTDDQRVLAVVGEAAVQVLIDELELGVADRADHRAAARVLPRLALAMHEAHRVVQRAALRRRAGQRDEAVLAFDQRFVFAVPVEVDPQARAFDLHRETVARLVGE